MEHYVPLHPKIVPFLKALLKIKDGKERMFEYMAYRQWLKRNHVSLEREISSKIQIRGKGNS